MFVDDLAPDCRTRRPGATGTFCRKHRSRSRRPLQTMLLLNQPRASSSTTWRTCSPNLRLQMLAGFESQHASLLMLWSPAGQGLLRDLPIASWQGKTPSILSGAPWEAQTRIVPDLARRLTRPSHKGQPSVGSVEPSQLTENCSRRRQHLPTSSWHPRGRHKVTVLLSRDDPLPLRREGPGSPRHGQARPLMARFRHIADPR
mmetsp:Transcript_38261/g.89885  ORF Transcript_38261/g.89885 Transcript_38261/m.89885 type:complete len:202 (-) Transcript_38261:91-696(-)